MKCVKVSTFCLLAVPELQKLISNIRKCLTYKQCSALGCFGSFWPDNDDQKMDPLPVANKLGPTRFKAKLLLLLTCAFYFICCRPPSSRTCDEPLLNISVAGVVFTFAMIGTVYLLHLVFR